MNYMNFTKKDLWKPFDPKMAFEERKNASFTLDKPQGATTHKLIRLSVERWQSFFREKGRENSQLADRPAKINADSIKAWR